MTSAAGVVSVFLLLGGAIAAGLYLLVQAEAENTRRMDRKAAERAVRRDTDATSKSIDDSETRSGADGRTTGWD